MKMPRFFWVHKAEAESCGRTDRDVGFSHAGTFLFSGPDPVFPLLPRLSLELLPLTGVTILGLNSVSWKVCLSFQPALAPSTANGMAMSG